jgi:GWxTD domain-containing protein
MTGVGLAFAAISLAQLVKHKDWGKSAEAYFLTPAEKQAWSKVANDDEATKFIAEYWARRDPNPATAANEFRDDVNRRIAAADEQFKMRSHRGSETSRGRLLVTLGLPTRVSTARAPTGVDDTGGVTAPSIDTRASPFEQSPVVVTTWTYAKDRFEPSLGLGELRIRINVDSQRGTDEIVGAGAAEKAIARLAEKSIVSSAPAGVAAVAPSVPAAATGPSASAPRPAAAAPAPAPATAPPAASAPPASAPAPAAPATLPAEVQAALDAALKSSKVEGAFWSGQFRSLSSEPFYAFQFYVPAEKAAAPLKFGGLVWSEANQPAASYWEDAVLSDVKSGSRTDKVFDRSIALPPGSYRGAFGLFPASGGAPVSTASATFRLESKPGVFGVSPLILANTLMPLTKRPGPTDPFVFGVDKPIKVEPKGDRTFAKEDSLWYFYAINDPTVTAAAAAAPASSATPEAGAAPAPAAAEPKPRIMTRVTVMRDGKEAFQPMTSPAELQPLGPNYYASGSEIPLASFEPGYYTFAIHVRDLNAPRDSAAFKGIERKEDFVVLNADGSLPARAAKPKAPAKKG